MKNKNLTSLELIEIELILMEEQQKIVDTIKLVRSTGGDETSFIKRLNKIERILKKLED
jgi:hypothetical protein